MTAAQPQPQPPSELSRLRSKVHSDLPRLEAAATFAVALSWWGYFVWRWFDLSEGVCGWIIYKSEVRNQPD